MEEKPEAPHNQGILTYIKKLATYVSGLAATFLGFAHDAESSALVFGKDLERIRIQTESAHGSLGQDEDIDQEHRILWGDIWSAVELSQKRSGEATVTTLEMQVSKIDSFTKKMESVVRASISRIQDLTYTFSQLHQRIEHLDNIYDERSVGEGESSLGNPHWMEGSQDKV